MVHAVSPKKSAVLPTVDPNGSPIDNAIGYKLPKAVNLVQLQTEITALSPVAVANIAMSGNVTENTAVLWVSPTGVDADAIGNAVNAHEPNPTWGIPQFMLDFQAALQKLRQDPEAPLSDADRDTLVKGVAMNFAMLVHQV